MEDQLNTDIIIDFESITQFPLFSFFQRVDSFVRNDIKNITSYYSGNIASLNNKSFSNLKDLISDMQLLFATFSLNKRSFTNFKWWLLIQQIEEIDTMLLMVDNSSKWLRSTITKGNFNPNPELQIPFSQGETLESIERDQLGSVDWDNTWVNLALKNELREEDYTSEAGFLIKANFDYQLNNFQINSIVGNPIGDNVLGKDLDKKLQFVDNDLKYLTPKDTFLQKVTIYINLRKGDNPEFPFDGLNPKIIVGSNINSVQYPTLFRQLTATFKKDDSIKSFTIDKINRQSDAVFIEFTVESRLGDLIPISLQA